MSIRIKPAEWNILFAISGAIDLIQVIIGFFGIGIIISEIADVVIGVIMVIYFLFRGFSISRHYQLFLSLLGFAALEELTGGFAPAWTLDIYNAKRIAKNDEASTKSTEEAELLLNSPTRRPLYEDGVRSPRATISDTGPTNVDGIRPPNGGLLRSDSVVK